MKTYRITELCGKSWENAIRQVTRNINNNLNANFSYDRDKWFMEKCIEGFALRFDENGCLLREENYEN